MESYLIPIISFIVSLIPVIGLFITLGKKDEKISVLEAHQLKQDSEIKSLSEQVASNKTTLAVSISKSESLEKEITKIVDGMSKFLEVTQIVGELSRTMIHNAELHKLEMKNLSERITEIKLSFRETTNEIRQNIEKLQATNQAPSISKESQ